MCRKRYERSVRKLRRFLYNQTSNEHADLSSSIQKLRHGNIKKPIVIADNCKYETSLTQRVEKVGNLSIDYNKALRAEMVIDKPKKAICEISPGFLRDNNLRVVYEALKVEDNSGQPFYPLINRFFFSNI